MPYPTVKALPSAPSRVSKPEVFVNESALFLAALPQFKTEYNALVDYVNSKIPNFYNYGSVLGANPANPTIPTYNDNVGGANAVAYTSSVDSLYLSLQDISSKVPTNVGNWIDATIAIQGSLPSDANKPLLSSLPNPHNRTQDRDAFNLSASAFTTSVRTNLNSIASLVSYVNTTCYANVDNGLVTDGTISEASDYGLVTETVT